MSILELLTEQHRKAEAAFESGVVEDIVTLLRMHDRIEREHMYPAAREAGLEDLIDHAIKEHHYISELVDRLHTGEQVLEELKTNVSEHVADEEAELFHQIRLNVSESKLRQLGKVARNIEKGGNGDLDAPILEAENSAPAEDVAATPVGVEAGELPDNPPAGLLPAEEVIQVPFEDDAATPTDNVVSGEVHIEGTSDPSI